MSAMPPIPATEDNPFAPWTSAWDTTLQMQQRWWTQWTEGLQLWTSWWLTPMPPLSGAEWAQTAEQGLRNATEAAHTVEDQVGDVVEANSPVPMTPPARPRPQPRHH